MSERAQPMAKKRRLFRRGLWENISVGLIALGVIMLMQPVSLILYSYSFVVLLAGTALFTVATKFPE
ncbi:MAG TPA: hypothetical protein VHA35_03170 [Dongiaceae bacterium]|jgi:hypothetical protein|nr:hypothetical protein [Dongiaceae bacterium]